ncbi:Ankrd17 [Symbiodinium pilosum]|uniref:Ankrd17 protein n=1 Tax=Symbiodinium pilosum TaxID=2952 RepID=A0A812LJG6_SYMPI|nr:Ankrd17 [Symbiodinium pilosum]
MIRITRAPGGNEVVCIRLGDEEMDEDVISLKHYLWTLYGWPTWMQRLLHHDVCLNDGTLLEPDTELQLVLLDGSDVCQEEKDEALSDAASNGHVEGTRALLAVGASPCQQFHEDDDSEGSNDGVSTAAGYSHSRYIRQSTALDVASTAGHAEVVQVLLEAITLQTQSKKDEALYRACARGDVEVVTPLLAANANPNYVFNFVYVSEFDDTLYDEQAHWTPLAVACLNGHPAVAQMLVEARADLSRLSGSREESICCPFEHAAREGHMQVLRVLLDCFGSDLSQEGKNAALYFASSAGCVEVVSALLEVGAAPNCEHASDDDSDDGDKDSAVDGYSHCRYVERSTALDMACTKGHKEVVQRLLKAPAAVTKQEKDDALYKASARGNVEVVHFLLAAKASPNYVFTFDYEYVNRHAYDEQACWTPLAVACLNGHPAVAQMLVEARADLLSSAGSRRSLVCSPLQHAAREGHVQVVDVLLSAFQVCMDDNIKTILRTILQDPSMQDKADVRAMVQTALDNA